MWEIWLGVDLLFYIGNNWWIIIRFGKYLDGWVRLESLEWIN